MIKEVFVALCIISSLLIVSAGERPNIIIILADDLGYADVGFQDEVAKDQVTTPNLNKLAKTGIIFRNAYATSPICSTSRLGLSTGRYHHRWGAYHYGDGGLPKTEFTIAETLRDGGYRTMKVGKVHLNNGPKQNPMTHGFEQFLGFFHHSWDFDLISQKDIDAYEKKKKGSIKSARSCGYGPLTRDNGKKESFENTTTTEVFGAESVRFINEKSSKPFFLQLEFNAVHTPLYRAPVQLEKKYGIPHRGFDRDAEVWKFPFWDPVKQPSFKEWYGQTCHLKKLDPYGRKIYLAHLELMDTMIGNIVKAVDEKGVLENTLIIFSSDNGGSHQSYANNGSLNTYKYCNMDGGIKVPMVISWPKSMPKGKKVDALVTHRDIFATICEITGLKSKKPLDAKSMLPVIKGELAVLHDEPLFWDSGRENSWVVRHGDWKLVYRKSTKQYQRYKIDDKGLVTDFDNFTIPTGLQLYNMGKDPGETKNLTMDYPEKTAAMQAFYKSWRANMSNPVRGSKSK